MYLANMIYAWMERTDKNLQNGGFAIFFRQKLTNLSSLQFFENVSKNSNICCIKKRNFATQFFIFSTKNIFCTPSNISCGIYANLITENFHFQKNRLLISTKIMDALCKMCDGCQEFIIYTVIYLIFGSTS